MTATDAILIRLKMVGRQGFSSDARRAARDVDGIKDAQLRAKDASLKQEQATAKLSRTTERYGRDSSQAKRALVELERAQSNNVRAQERLRIAQQATSDGHRDEHQNLRKLIGDYQLLGRLKKLLGPAAGITGLGLAAGAASAGAAGAVALGAAAAPAAGGLVAYPALAATAAQGLGVFRLATAGVADALGGLNERLDRSSDQFRSLTPEAQALVTRLDRLKVPLRDLQRLAQRNLTPGLDAGISSASRNLPVLRPIVGGTASAIGSTAAAAGRMVGSRAWGADLATQGARNVRWLERGGTAALRLANATRNVVVAGGPLVDWMTKGAARAADLVNAEVGAARETGRLTRFFNAARQPMRQIWQIASGLGVSVWNIARGGRALGNDLLGSLGKNARALAAWTGSQSGQRSIGAAFERARAPIYAVARLARDVVMMFGRLSAQDGLAPMIDQLDTELLPVIERVMRSTTAAFGPHLLNLITATAEAFEPLAGSSGPLIVFVDTLTAFADASAWIAQNVPGGSAAITTLFGALALWKGLGLAGTVTGLSSMVKWLGTLTPSARAAAAAARTLTFSQIALNAALAANPILLAVAAIAALSVGFYIAYKRVRRFHDAVDSVWDFISKYWPLLTLPLSAPLTLLLTGVRYAGRLKHALESIWSGVAGMAKSAFDSVIGVVVGALNKVIRAYNSLPGIVKRATGGNISEIDLTDYSASPYGVSTGTAPRARFSPGGRRFAQQLGVGGGGALAVGPAVTSSPMRRKPLHVHLNVNGREIARANTRADEEEDAFR